MRYPASEKLEIIRLVEQSHLPVRRTLEKLGIQPARLAVFADKAPFVRTVRCRTVANTLSIGFDVRRWSQCSAGKSKKASRASRSFVRQATAFSYLEPYLSANTLIAASAAARVTGSWNGSLAPALKTAGGCADRVGESGSCNGWP